MGVGVRHSCTAEKHRIAELRAYHKSLVPTSCSQYSSTAHTPRPMPATTTSDGHSTAQPQLTFGEPVWRVDLALLSAAQSSGEPQRDCDGPLRSEWPNISNNEPACVSHEQEDRRRAGGQEVRKTFAVCGGHKTNRQAQEWLRGVRASKSPRKRRWPRCEETLGSGAVVTRQTGRHESAHGEATLWWRWCGCGFVMRCARVRCKHARCQKHDVENGRVSDKQM